MEITVILTYSAQILGCLCASFVLYLIPKIKKYFDTRLTREQYEQLTTLVETFVKAADQQFKSEDSTGIGRKTYVEKQLQEAGYILTEQINSIIEAAVYNLDKEVSNGNN